MSTIATVTDKLHKADDSVCRAWQEYYDYVHELRGREYEDAEPEAWELLQEELRDIEDRRRMLAGLPAID